VLRQTLRESVVHGEQSLDLLAVCEYAQNWVRGVEVFTCSIDGQAAVDICALKTTASKMRGKVLQGPASSPDVSLPHAQIKG
jgi:hypothetical protein